MRRSPRLPGLYLILVLVTALASIAGCARSDAPLGSVVTVRDSSGIRIVDQSLIVVPRVSLGEPYLTLGSISGEEDAFYRVSAIERFDDGSWMVVNAGTSEVRVFDADGRFLSSIGGRGDGPGELAQLTTATLFPGDSVFAWDLVGRRGVVYTRSGDSGRDVRLSDELSGALVLPVGVAEDRVVMTTASLFRDAGGDGGRILRPSNEGYIMDAEASPVAELGEIPGAESWYVQDGSRTSIRSFPFAKRGVAVVAGDRIVIGDSGENDLRVHGASGDLEAIWRVLGEPERVTSSDWQEERRRAVAAADSADDLRAVRAMFEEIPQPGRRPVWSSMLGAEDGSVWVRQYTAEGVEGGGEWWVISPEGEVVTEVVLPGDFRPLWSDGEVVAGSLTDDLDVEYLHFYRVSAGARDAA